MAETVTTKRRDPEVVRRALEVWLLRRLEGRTLDSLSVAAPAGHGYSNDTLMVDAVVGGARVPLVVQAAPTGEGLFPEYPIARMAKLQRDLRDHGDVPVANVRWLEEDPAVLGAPFYVMDRIGGRVPDESPKAYHAAGWVSEASAEERRELWMSMLEAMARLHRIDVVSHFAYLTESRWGMALDADPAAERVRQWREYTLWASDTDTPPAGLLNAWDALSETAPAPRPGMLSICWGDAKLGNVMFSGFNVAALLDWELCGVGHAEEDLMNQLAVDAVLADMFGVARIDGFLTSEETVELYEQLIGRELVATNWWYAFALAKMAAEIHRILRQTRKLSGVATAVDLEPLNVAMPALRRELKTIF